MLFFTKEIDLINEFRLNPWFLKELIAFGDVSVEENYDKKYIAQLSVHFNNPENIYFLSNSKEIYVDNWIMSIFFFVIMKIL